MFLSPMFVKKGFSATGEHSHKPLEVTMRTLIENMTSDEKDRMLMEHQVMLRAQEEVERAKLANKKRNLKAMKRIEEQLDRIDRWDWR